MDPISPQPESDQRAETFFGLWTRNERVLRAIIRPCVWRIEDIDDVMQEVSIVAWRKFASLQNHEEFLPWVAMITRYEVLMHRRRQARSRVFLSEETVERLAEEAAGELSLRHQQLEALEHCIEKLPPERRELAMTAYAPGNSIKDIAGQLNRTETSLYQLLARIRQDLFLCVEKRLTTEGLS